jgi:hypothetical protein
LTPAKLKNPSNKSFPAFLGWTALAVYLVWNLAWLAQGRIPPSLLNGLFGWPSPTTGLTRATLAALDGRWTESFHWHPLAVLIWPAWFATLAAAARPLVQRRPPRLPLSVLQGWLILLTLAWAIKWMQGPSWW